MKIAWFTPLSRQSAIGRFSEGVVTELAKLAEVDLCHFSAGEIRESRARVRRFGSASDVTEKMLSSYDLTIYNFGNYLPFHREIFRLSRRWPGVCILHDFVMHHFFAQYCFEELHAPEAYVQMMERRYGDEGRVAAGRNSCSGGKGVWESDDVVRFPLFEEALQGALGVVTHSEFFRKRAADSFPGPSRRIPLAYDADTSGQSIPRAALKVEADRVLIVTVGHVNPNKQIPAVIEALGSLGPLAQRATYVILGPCPPDHRRQLEAVIRGKQMERGVHLAGQVTDDVLRAYLMHADICVNLRFPAIEGASASVIEEMMFGKPVIVTDTGFFAELPGECVLKVRTNHVSELAAALERLITDAAARTKLGVAAREFARREFRADRYAREILDFAWETRSTKPLLGLADGIGVECARMGIGASMPIVDTVAREIHGTFCSQS